MSPPRFRSWATLGPQSLRPRRVAALLQPNALGLQETGRLARSKDTRGQANQARLSMAHSPARRARPAPKQSLDDYKTAQVELLPFKQKGRAFLNRVGGRKKLSAVTCSDEASSRVRHSPLIRYISRSITCAGSNNLEPAGYAPPHQWSPRDPINSVCQLASKILAKSRYALIVPTNCRLGFSGRCTMKADPHHARLAASSRAETVSQSSSSEVPDSISSMRLLISALHAADAPASSGSRL